LKGERGVYIDIYKDGSLVGPPEIEGGVGISYNIGREGYLGGMVAATVIEEIGLRTRASLLGYKAGFLEGGLLEASNWVVRSINFTE